jgi:iron complex transport system ATP-binding protein
MDEPEVIIQKAGHSYDGNRWQFRNLDLAIKRGDVVAILGPNGRGKSTLLRTMAGLLKLDEGTARIEHTTGFVPQDFAGSFPYSVLDIVLMGRARHVPLFRNPTKRDAAISMDALASTGMADYADRSFNSLSGGEKQLVLIARALAGENSTLLLDEPASALDLKNQDGVLALVRQLADEKQLAIAFTTHQPNHALAAADHVLLMLAETRTIFGHVDEVMTDENLEQLYGIAIRSLKFQDGANERTAIIPLFRQRKARSDNIESTIKHVE